MPDFIPRPAQATILQYTHGKMGIAAVPGSGKTHTLSYLAATLIASDKIQDGQEVLVVTLVNSAVENFSKRISAFIRKFHLLENIGYRVRTLHGLAHDIVRERPDLAGLENNFQILDERASNDILDQIVSTWQRNHPQVIESYTHADFLNKRSFPYDKWKQLLKDLASAFIRQAKDMELMPSQIDQAMAQNQKEHDLLRFGFEAYRDYQNALSYHAAIDFQDLIRLAYHILKNDRDYLKRLQERWPYILEDEAQDSSALQERILRLLCGETGNWVRVGDPNQAIYETFTTANPRFLLDFLKEKDVQHHDLPNSGRSTSSIILLANHLIEWNQSQPSPELIQALVPPYIEPTPLDDPQPNPPDTPEKIFLYTQEFPPEKEERIIVNSVKEWLEQNPDQTVAILVTRNEKGANIVQKLKEKHIPTVELLQTSFATRKTASKLAKLLSFFADPLSSKKLSEAFAALYEDQFEEEALKDTFQLFCGEIKKQSKLEDFLFRQTEPLRGASINSEEWVIVQQAFQRFLQFLKEHQAAALLPINQFLLTISTYLFTDAHDLALAYKLAEMMERAKRTNPSFSIKDCAESLQRVYRNRLRLEGFSEEELEFDPDKHKGEVVVSTIHKAKGLEWDRVYIVSANNYDFPSNQPYDQFIPEKEFIRDHLNLEAEMLALLKALSNKGSITEGEATKQARIRYSAERLRLLYVGITRARKELVITWNKGKHNDCVMAIPFVELSTYWEQHHATRI